MIILTCSDNDCRFVSGFLDTKSATFFVGPLNETHFSPNMDYHFVFEDFFNYFGDIYGNSDEFNLQGVTCDGTCVSSFTITSL